MSEQLHHHDSGEKINVQVETERQLKETAEKAASAKEISHDELEQIRHNIETRAISSEEVNVHESEAKPASHDFSTHKQLKMTSYKRTLQHVQSRLRGPEKAFSKTIHRPVVERLSNITAATLARPNSLLIAGAITFIGSLASVYMARHYGFAYNYSWFVVLFVGGYGLGIVLELLARLFRRRRQDY